MAAEETYDPRFGTATKANSLSRPAGPVETVRGALDGAERLAVRIENLSRRLVGSVPEDANLSTGEPGADGLFYEMSNHASRVMSMIGDAESAISRIERALP